MTSRQRDWLRRAGGSVRVRVTLLAAGAFAVTLIVASWLLLRALERSLVEDIREGDQAMLSVEAVTVSEGGIPEHAEIGEYDGQLFARWQGDDGQWFEIPVESNESAGFVPAGPDRIPAGAVDVFADVECASGCIHSESLVPGEDAVLSTFSPLAEVRATIATTRQLLWLVGPALVALVAGLAWLLAGRALRPVRTMTSRVAAIESQSLHERVPEPAAGDEIAELAQTMNQMLGRLERASETSRRLVSDASHELRTPMAVMRTELEVASRDAATDWSSTSDVLLGELDRLQHLVDDLLLLARGDERGLAADDVNLASVVADVASRRRGVAVEVDSQWPQDRSITGDGHALSRALEHLVANAARSAVARVAVAIEPVANGDLAVHVDDDGRGIPEDQRANVVRRFVRLDEGRARDQGGSGLGLAVASDVAAGHGGRLEITDSPLGGARVTIVLPTQRSV